MPTSFHIQRNSIFDDYRKRPTTKAKQKQPSNLIQNSKQSSTSTLRLFLHLLLWQRSILQHLFVNLGIFSHYTYRCQFPSFYVSIRRIDLLLCCPFEMFFLVLYSRDFVLILPTYLTTYLPTQVPHFSVSDLGTLHLFSCPTQHILLSTYTYLPIGTPKHNNIFNIHDSCLFQHPAVTLIVCPCICPTV